MILVIICFYIFSLPFLFISLPCLHAETSLGSRGGGDGHMNNGVFLRFGFDDSKSWENFNYSQRQGNEEARWVCCIYTAHVMLVSLWCIHTIGTTGVDGLIYISAWSSELLVSTIVGNSQAPWIVKRATDGLHVFIYMRLEFFFL